MKTTARTAFTRVGFTAADFGGLYRRLGGSNAAWLASLLLVVVALVIVAPTALHADARRLEAVGAVPIEPGASARTSLRDAAIQRALREAVSRIARELLLEAEATVPLPPGSAPDQGDPVRRPDGVTEDPAEEELDRVLGKQMVRYTSRFRIVEDRGEMPAMFSESPTATSEYVVVVDVQVEVEQVRQRLIEGGLLVEVGQTLGSARRFRLEVEGLSRYPAYAAFLELLRAESGDPSVQPEAFEPGRVSFIVAAEDEPREFMWRLIQRRAPGFEIEPLPARGEADTARALRLAVQWTPPEPLDEAGLPAVEAWDGRGSSRQPVRTAPPTGRSSR